MLMSIVFAVFVVITTGNDFRLMLVALFGGLVAAFSVSRLHRRSGLARAGLYVAAVNVFTYMGLFLYGGTLRFGYDVLRELGLNTLASVGNGIFSAVMAIGLLPYLRAPLA